MRFLSTLLLTVLSVFSTVATYAAVEYQLTVRLKSGEPQVFRLSTCPRVVFTSTQMVIQSETFSTSYPIEYATVDRLEVVSLLATDDAPESQAGSVNEIPYIALVEYPTPVSGLSPVYVPFITEPDPVDPVNISSAILTLPDGVRYRYTGQVIEPEVSVRLEDTVLTGGTDYTVNYSNNVNPGTATVTVTGKDNYTGTLSTEFTIYKDTTVYVVINGESIAVNNDLETVSLFETSYGRVAISNICALPGETIKIWIIPATGWLLDEETLTPKLTEEDSHYAFVMPEDEERITLNVTFVDEIIVGLSDAACPFGFRYTDGRTVWLSGIDESVPISIYDARGTMVSARVARTPDTAVIHLDELPAGLYIISVNHQSYKIQKK